MKILRTYPAFSRQQRIGMLFLLFLIAVLQSLYFFTDISPEKPVVADQEKWIAFQQTVDSLKQIEAENRKPKRYPFNPNYITDYKGYTLGMAAEEIDRLFAYRKSGKFVNSAAEFQQVTRISDSLLETLRPWFKFPEWVKARKKSSAVKPKTANTPSTDAKPAAAAKDINTATVEELKAIRGIGEVLSKRIVKFRDRLGGFLLDEQLYDVYGLQPEVAREALRRFTVLNPPEIKKIDINTASAEALASIVYLRYKVAAAMVAYRENKGKIRSFEELTEIPGFPVEKIDRIKLYLIIE